MVSALIHLGVEVDTTDHLGETPLHLACDDASNSDRYGTRESTNEQDAILGLIAAGATLSIRNASGLTPLDIACRRGNYLIAAKLLDLIHSDMQSEVSPQQTTPTRRTRTQRRAAREVGWDSHQARMSTLREATQSGNAATLVLLGLTNINDDGADLDEERIPHEAGLSTKASKALHRARDSIKTLSANHVYEAYIWASFRDFLEEHIAPQLHWRNAVPLAADRAIMETQSNDGLGLLHIAAMNGHTTAITVLLALFPHIASVHRDTSQGRTALDLALEHNRHGASEVLQTALQSCRCRECNADEAGNDTLDAP